MNTETRVEYHLMVDTKNGEVYYVTYQEIGGGYGEFIFSTEPFTPSEYKGEKLYQKRMLLTVIELGGSAIFNNEFIKIEYSFDFKDIVDVKVQKRTITSNFEIEYI